VSARVLHDGLSTSAARHAKRTALVDDEGRTVSYGGLDGLATRTQGLLADAQVGPGDRVGVMLPKSIDAVAVLSGILRAGAVCVPVASDMPGRRFLC
jgi:acyl-CoA synthetase (AMP-forming)/AMP-acid ligase II